MGLFSIIVTCLVLFLIFSIFGWCCRRKTKGIVFSTTEPGQGPGIAVQQPQQTCAPYPVQVGHTMHQQAAPPFAPAAHQPVIPPYPMQTSMPMPMTQQPIGMPMPQPHSAPYPMQPSQMPGIVNPPYPPVQMAPNQNPPSYAEAVSNEAYSKQAPYNPHY